MKNTFKYIISIAVLLAGIFSLAPVAYADGDDEEINVLFDKTVDGPELINGEAVYTITLEAFVTGSIVVTESTAPADIILVLDRSGSMEDGIDGNPASGANQRINILKQAVQKFVNTVKTSNESMPTENRDSFGGHRIAIVWFSGNRTTYNSELERYNTTNVVYTGITGLNQFINVENLTPVAEVQGWPYQAAQVTYNNRNLLNVTADGGTYTDVAMEKADEILRGAGYSSTATPNRSRVVVFFTDGQPGSGRAGDNWMDWSNYYGYTDRLVANGCIAAANTIKNSPTYGATIYSVGLFNKATTTKDATTTYLSYTSSDYTDKTEMPTSTSAYVTVSNQKSIVVNSSGALDNVFSNIAVNEGGKYDAASSSTVLVDIVAQSFSIPEGTDLGTIRVYKDTCAVTGPNFLKYVFADDLQDITNEVTLIHDDGSPEVKVSGFNYGANWCGWDETANDGEGGPHGNKLVVKIPITVNEEAVGGPAVETNEEGSQLILINEDGDTLQTHPFPKPTLKIPVSIWIEKHGLVDDDSAVFTLARAPYYPGATYENYTDPESIFYVDESDTEGIKLAKTWENFTKVIINEKNMQTVTVDGVEHKVVKLSGLDPDYYYRIKEDAWAWGYQYQDGGIVYTIGDNLANPIQVYNVPDPDAPKHAESVVRNVFTERTTIIPASGN